MPKRLPRYKGVLLQALNFTELNTVLDVIDDEATAVQPFSKASAP
jgi:hypothetical protein